MGRGGWDQVPARLQGRDEPRTLRWVIAQMASETARHAGHADIVRELIDGASGR
ncbi:DUF664 domain-containing protein [Actinoplanes sp. NPDC049548]|uniref:mycothiol transferase n=1 Tax=Actinoplanes sp. NPDC049548 TaxID=3155152 RepID=UPI0034219C13